jgi:hypothetical protein
LLIPDGRLPDLPLRPELDIRPWPERPLAKLPSRFWLLLWLLREELLRLLPVDPPRRDESPWLLRLLLFVLLVVITVLSFCRRLALRAPVRWIF